MSALERLLEGLPRWTLVGGKGGVGKTTCAASLASYGSSRGARTLLVSTDPARSLGDAIGVVLGHEPRTVAGRPNLHAAQLDATTARDAFLTRWRGALVSIVDRGTYLDQDDVAALIDAALPGADEAMALLALAGMETSGGYERFVIDTAPTGHTLRLLALPETFRALIALLDRMQEKHRFMVRALTHRYRPDAEDAFLDEMRRQIDALRTTLLDPRRGAALLVTRLEPVVIAETARYAETLPTLGLSLAALVINAVPATLGPAETEALAELYGVAPAAPRFWVPVMEAPPIGLDAVDAWGHAMRAGLPGGGPVGGPRRGVRRRPAAGGPPQRQRTRNTAEIHHHRQAAVIGSPRGDASESVPHVPTDALVRQLTIVGGKGGVGKTTAACALAIEAARAGQRVLLVSTDPAPSVADALALPIGDAGVGVDGVPGLTARQMDASSAFERMRLRYRERIDELFDAFVASGVDVSHDRIILRDLLALAPPGIDEVYALAALGEALADARFDAIIVDPAPTGHLLRLLEMPSLALDWSHRLMRLMLKYKEVAGLGDAAEDLLAFARRTRALAALLADRTRAGLLAVALDEPLVRAETARLADAVRKRGVDLIGILWNRATGAPAPLPVSPPVPQFVAAALDPPPRGVEALERWRATWASLDAPHG